MSDQFVRYNKKVGIVGQITKIKDQIEDAKWELASLKTACEKLSQERDAAIQRAEKAEGELIEAQQAAEFWRGQAEVAKIERMRRELTIEKGNQ